jgi:outer membrane protein assembly factor BamA
MVLDSREHVFFPTRGMFHQLRSIFFPSFLGSAYGFTSYEIDLRWYFPLRPDMLVAVQTYGEFTTGHVGRRTFDLRCPFRIVSPQGG